jgi:hypothetical protein
MGSPNLMPDWMAGNIRSECVKSMAEAEKRPKTLNISDEIAERKVAAASSRA